ncbi:MAG: ABC transporter permease [Bauldia sp.]
MNPVLQRLVRRPTFPPALILPTVIMLIFSFFALSAATDPQRVMPVVSLGIVDLDSASPAPIGPRLAAGLDQALPMSVVSFAAEADGRRALDEGDVVALLVIPEGFAASLGQGTPATLPIIVSQHLSQLEGQLVTTLPVQLQAVIGGAVSALAGGAANPPPAPMVTVVPEFLHAAPNPTALVAPAVMLQATWLAGFVGALLVFITTRGERTREAALTVSMFRSVVPLVATALASLVLAIVVSWTTGLWGSVFVIWGVVWVSAAAVALLFLGLFSLLSFAAIVIVLPTVFYQAALAGAQAPIAALPDWLRWAADAVPFSAVVEGYRWALIGGPDSWNPWGTMLIIAAIGLALVWIGTFVHARLRRVTIAAAT